MSPKLMQNKDLTMNSTMQAKNIDKIYDEGSNNQLQAPTFKSK